MVLILLGFVTPIALVAAFIVGYRWGVYFTIVEINRRFQEADEQRLANNARQMQEYAKSPYSVESPDFDPFTIKSPEDKGQ